MRALCGAIITAGALIGLGLTALAYGIRYQSFGPDLINQSTHQMYGVPSLVLILVVLIGGTVTGIGIAFLGLMYHHERRYMEQRGNFGSPSDPAAPPL